MKGIVYYTDGRLDKRIAQDCRAQLLKADMPIDAVGLNEIIYFGDSETILKGEPSVKMMHWQILTGLETSLCDFVFLCEHDVMYHPSHFDFTPPRDDTFYFNTNVYKRWQDGHIVWTDDLQQNSGLCASRALLLDFFTMRFAQIFREGNNRHYEPQPRYGCKVENWQSEFPNVDIRHDKNLTKSKRTADEFRNPKYAKGFRVVDSIPGWEAI